MSDLFVRLSGNPVFRKAIKTLHLPVPLPPVLRRARGPWEERPLGDRPVIVYHAEGGTLAPVLAQGLVGAGASIHLAGENPPVATYKERGEAWGRSPDLIKEGEIPEGLRPHALILDATGLQTPEDLKSVYRFGHGWIRRLGACGRILVTSRPPEQASTARAASAARALEGFTRSMGREIGRKGSTANILVVGADAEDRLEPVLRFMLSARSAYISGQPLCVSSMARSPGRPPLTQPLKGKVVLVTGAARGIGKGTATAMAREGAHVIVMDLPKDEEALNAVAEKLEGTALLGDVTAPETPDAIHGLVEKQFGGVDVLVHNAGITRDKTLGNMDAQRWDQVMGVNLISMIRINERLDGLIREGGRIICLSSIAGISGNFGQTNYSASKAGIIGYVRAMAVALAERGITVNAMAPGFIETRLTAAIPLVTRQVGRRLSNLSQGGLPVDVAETAVFLASPGAVGCTGQILRVCGGSFIGA